MSLVFELFFTFLKIGLFTFGGGYAMISVIERICVEEKGWISHEDMMDVVVLAESTPGPIAINCATYVGYRKKGLSGAGIATLGIVLPSFCIIYLISLYLDHYLEITWIAHAFQGIKLAVGILIVDAARTMLRKMNRNWLPRTIFCASFAAMLLIDLFAWKFSVIGMMLIAAAFSLIVFLTRSGTKQKEGGAG